MKEVEYRKKVLSARRHREEFVAEEMKGVPKKNPDKIDYRITLGSSFLFVCLGLIFPPAFIVSVIILAYEYISDAEDPYPQEYNKKKKTAFVKFSRKFPEEQELIKTDDEYESFHATTIVIR